MKNFSAFVILVIFLLSMAGCGGGSGSFFSALGDAFSSGFSSGGSSDGGSGDLGGSGGGDGIQIAQVHNPEPATMLLWGAGLAGAALLRRRRKV